MFIGGLVMVAGVVLQIAQIVASFIEKDRLRDVTGDPWNARSLEWSVPSPVPFYNFTSIPTVATRDAFWEMKQHSEKPKKYEDIILPKNTAAGIYVATFATLACFAFVWNIIWLIALSIIGIIVMFVRRAFDDHTEYTLTAAEVRKLDEAQMRKIRAAGPVKEYNPDDDMGIRGLVKWLWAYGVEAMHKKKWRKA
jgi:cytochrome o ubiquinol oxidase subunit 1